MLPYYDDAKARHQERLNEAEYARLVQIARGDRANHFKNAREHISQRVRALFQHVRAVRRPAPQLDERYLP
jgi:hypothetical protein